MNFCKARFFFNAEKSKSIYKIRIFFDINSLIHEGSMIIHQIHQTMIHHNLINVYISNIKNLHHHREYVSLKQIIIQFFLYLFSIIFLSPLLSKVFLCTSC